MNYDHPELLDQLAAAYALGVLRFRARARFERLCLQPGSALTARHRWEDRLLPLAMDLPAVVPTAARWQQIQRRIGELNGRAAAPSVRWWLAAAASVAAVALLVGRMTPWNEPNWQPVATLAQANAPANTQPLWRIERDANSSRLNLRAVGTITIAASKSYELWVLPSGAGHPVSLGVLPRQGRLEVKLTAVQRQFLMAGLQVAVTIEPDGGSPTGLPTGPVVIVAPIVHAT